MALLGILIWGEGLLGITLRRVSTRSEVARGIVLGGRDLGFSCSMTSGGDAGSEFGSRLHPCVFASGLGDECEDKKGDPVEEKDEPVQPRKGLEGLVLRAVAGNCA